MSEGLKTSWYQNTKGQSQLLYFPEYFCCPLIINLSFNTEILECGKTEAKGQIEQMKDLLEMCICGIGFLLMCHHVDQG